jgi:sarcosine oxidase, subunit gamma
MADIAATRRSALADLSLPAATPAVAVSDAGAALRLVYRGSAAVLGAAFGPPLPLKPCRAETQDDRAALWLGPDEWLLIVSGNDAAALVASLESAVAGKAASLVDVSHRHAGLVVAGTQAADVLNAGCPLDLDPDAFPVGMCTRTLFGKAEVMLWRTATDTFRLEVWRSFAPYVVGLLAAAIADLAP